MSQTLVQILIYGLSNGAVIALNALGVTLVYSVARIVNFAYGDLFALSTVLVTQLILSMGLRAAGPVGQTLGGLLFALVAAIAFGALTNVGIERVAFRPFAGSSQLGPLIASIGLSFIMFQLAISWRVLAEVGWGNPEHHSDIDNLANVPHTSIPHVLPNLNLVEALGLPLQLRFMLKDALLIVVALLLTLFVHWILNNTRFGRSLRAWAQDSEAAALCGINGQRAVRSVFALGGALAGAAAFVFTMYYERPFGQHGAESGLLAFTAAVLGGVGNPGGALVSGLLLGVIAAFSDFFLPAQWTPVLVLAVLIMLLALRPRGLVGESDEYLQVAWLQADTEEQRSSGKMQYWQPVVLLLLAVLYPLADQAFGIHNQALVNNMLVFVLLTMGLNIILGVAGMLDLGYAACFAVGGYTAALLMDKAHVDFLVALVAGTSTAALFGLLNGLITLNMRGDYLAVVALAFGQMVPRIVVNLSTWTGGSIGLGALPAPHIFGFSFVNQTQRYYLALALVALAALISIRLVDSRFGRAWRALSSDELAAQSSGVSLLRVKPFAFMVGAAIAGIAAVLSAGIFSYVDPAQSEFLISAIVLAMVVVGGSRRISGVILGAVLVASIDQIILPLLGAWWASATGGSGVQIATLNYMAFGLVLYVSVYWRLRRSSEV